jgi:hypothetical protein
MYHRIVARKVRSAFDQISDGNWEPMIAGMAPEFSYRARPLRRAPHDRRTPQNMHMRWARISEIHTLEDNVVLQRALDCIAASGILEAHEEPIADTEPGLVVE